MEVNSKYDSRLRAKIAGYFVFSRRRGARCGFGCIINTLTEIVLSCLFVLDNASILTHASKSCEPLPMLAIRLFPNTTSTPFKTLAIPSASGRHYPRSCSRICRVNTSTSACIFLFTVGCLDESSYTVVRHDVAGHCLYSRSMFPLS